MADQDARQSAGGGRHARLRRLVHLLRTERGGPRRDPLAVAVGVFIGCTPLYGLHLIMSLLAADLFRLNRLKVYLAANISNPFFLPFLVFAEVQVGAWLRRGSFHALTREAVSAVSPWVFGMDLVVGSLALGVFLAIALGSLTYFVRHEGRADPEFSALVDRAAGRYAATSLTAWEFANAKLRADPVYRTAMQKDLLPGGDTLLDIGCGQGLMLALLVEARGAGGPSAEPAETGRWPIYNKLIGIDTRPHVARLAEEALADPSGDLKIVQADVREFALQACDAVLVFDVLHMMPREAQDTLLATVRGILRAGGVILVREADASAGWRFRLVRVGNRLKALAGRRWHQHFAFRKPDEWVACFRQAGFVVQIFPGPADHPFGNTLFRLTREPAPADEAAILSR